MARKATVAAKQEVETKKDEAFLKDSNSVPSYLANVTKTSKIGNVDTSDLIIPRVKLLQSTSDEPKTYNNARMGEFWHTLGDVPMGKSLAFVPIIIRKSIVLWAPRGDERGVLARSNDCVNWDRSDDTFEVKLKNIKDKVKWQLKDSVKQSGLAEFGSQNPGDPDSPPAAALTYQILMYFPDFHDLSPAIVINTRSAAKRAKMLISKIEMSPVDHYAQRYIMTPSVETGDEGEYYNYNYTKDGYATEDQYKLCKGKFEQFNDDPNWRANDEEEDVVSQGGGGAKAPPEGSTKF